MKSKQQHIFKATIFFLSLLLVSACATQNDTAANRRLQNLSARYNYMYNASILLKEFEAERSQTYSNYDNILPVYPLPGVGDSTGNKSLTEIIKKAQTIIAEKNVSNYIDEAYILLGKANFYQSNYFNASEYFDYVARTYKKDKPVYLKALTWEARSQFQLNNLKAGKALLDSAQKVFPLIKKKRKAETLATMAQLQILEEKYDAAATLLKAALKQQHSSEEKSRWNYILAQLYQIQKDYKQSFNYYDKVAGSNAPFEMYFNANLNRIKVKGMLNGTQSNIQQQILALLKDDKNEGYIDQIYFNTAELYAEKSDMVKAEEYYLLSIASSKDNQYQKGLNYLRIADLNFGKKGNFLKAKLYYDSAINTLPKTFPGYAIISKKSQNLQYLSERFELIGFQDSLQMIAKLPAEQRLAKIDAVLGPEVQQVPEPVVAATNIPFNSNDPFEAEPSSTNATFYFNNQAAISNGFTDFRRKWGSRKLENNWRQSTRTAAQAVAQSQNTAIVSSADSLGLTAGIGADRKAQIQLYLDNLPLSLQQLDNSNQKILKAYTEIAAFYLQELGDKIESTRIYEILLERFPNNPQNEVIFYSLYRAYLGEDEKKSEKYKQLVLKEFPNSIYAKTILDPEYALKQSAKEQAAMQRYNAVFTAYENKNYSIVIAETDAALKEDPDNIYKSQFEYLKAIAIGRTNNVDALLPAFNDIVSKYPEDNVITPLVKEHIAYINNHLREFKLRQFALLDFNSNDPRFIVEDLPPTSNQNTNNQTIAQKTDEKDLKAPLTKEPVKNPVVAANPVVANPTTKEKEVKNPITKEQVINPVVVTKPVIANPTIIENPKEQVIAVPVIKEPAKDPIVATKPVVANPITKTNLAPIVPTVKYDGLFSKQPASIYYFVVNVKDASLTISSSRFGIGQFNRSNFTNNDLSHQLKQLENDQLIYIGVFNSLAAVKNYSELIFPQLKNIMKVPANNYSSFVISKENFDKIDSREKINQYLTFYDNSY